MDNIFKFELTSELRDTISGLKGIAAARCQYMNGCLKYEIQPKGLKDGKIQDSYWIDEEQLVLVKSNFKEIKPNGGPQNLPKGTYNGR